MSDEYSEMDFSENRLKNLTGFPGEDIVPLFGNSGWRQIMVFLNPSGFNHHARGSMK
jgi:hypothetical protein